MEFDHAWQGAARSLGLNHNTVSHALPYKDGYSGGSYGRDRDDHFGMNPRAINYNQRQNEYGQGYPRVERRPANVAGALGAPIPAAAPSNALALPGPANAGRQRQG